MNAADYLTYQPTRTAKLVIYTAITQGFDNLCTPSYISPDADYVCFTDDLSVEPSIWQLVCIPEAFLPGVTDAVRRAKYFKIFPHLVLQKYHYSVWLDGNVNVLTNDLEQRVIGLINEGIGLSANIHPTRDCAYDEAYACIHAALDQTNTVLSEIKHLKCAGFPAQAGLFEMNMIYRCHDDSKIRELMDDWWSLILRYSFRDQISFPFVLFKHQVICEPIFSKNARQLRYFSFAQHQQLMFSSLYVDVGSGFVEKSKINNHCILSAEGCFEIEFDLSVFSERFLKLRFDPVENKLCTIFLSSILFKDRSGIIISYSLTQLLPFVEFNGILQDIAEGEKHIEFNSLDPFIIFFNRSSKNYFDNIFSLSFKGLIKYHDKSKKINDLWHKNKYRKELLELKDTQIKDIHHELNQHTKYHAKILELKNSQIESFQCELQHQDKYFIKQLELKNIQIKSLQNLTNKNQEIARKMALDYQLVTNDAIKLRAKIHSIYRSITWKIGYLITWLPRKIFRHR